MVFLQTWRASIIPLVAVPGLAHRHVRGDAGDGLLAEHAVALRPRALDRHRRGRCDRRGGERGAAHRARAVAARRDATRDGGSVGPDHRDRAGALRGVRADGVRQRADRTVLSAVRADDRDLDGHLGVQLADAQPGAGLAAAQAARRAARRRAARRRSAVRLVLPRLQSVLRARVRRLHRRVSLACCAWRLSPSCSTSA